MVVAAASTTTTTTTTQSHVLPLKSPLGDDGTPISWRSSASTLMVDRLKGDVAAMDKRLQDKEIECKKIREEANQNQQNLKQEAEISEVEFSFCFFLSLPIQTTTKKTSVFLTTTTKLREKLTFNV